MNVLIDNYKGAQGENSSRGLNDKQQIEVRDCHMLHSAAVVCFFPKVIYINNIVISLMCNCIGPII